MARQPRRKFHCILSVDPCVEGFGFAVMESRIRLIDWGLAWVWARDDREFLARVEAMIDRYNPVLVTLEDRSGYKRKSRNLRRLEGIIAYCGTRRLPVALVSRHSIQGVFGEMGRTKQDIALAIAKEFPELEPQLPVSRTRWTPEDERMHVFDAISFVIALRDADRSDSGAAV